MFLILVYRDRGGGGAGRAIALPLFYWDLFSRAPVDMEKVIVELMGFSLKRGVLMEDWDVCLSERLQPDVRARIICKT